MTYLSYPKADGIPVATTVLDKFSIFKQTGTVYALEGVICGFNTAIIGVDTPNAGVNFDKAPKFRGGTDVIDLGDFGRKADAGNGNVAIVWPL